MALDFFYSKKSLLGPWFVDLPNNPNTCIQNNPSDRFKLTTPHKYLRTKIIMALVIMWIFTLAYLTTLCLSSGFFVVTKCFLGTKMTTKTGWNPHGSRYCESTRVGARPGIDETKLTVVKRRSSWKWQATWMSQEVSKWLEKIGYNLLINGVYGGYNSFTNHLLTSWDIQEPLWKICDRQNGWKSSSIFRVIPKNIWT